MMKPLLSDALRRKLVGRALRDLPSLLAKNVAYALQYFGPRAIMARRRDAVFDRQWGTETSRLVNLSSLDLDAARARDGVRYQPSGGDDLAFAVASFGIEPAEWNFIDYGSGKGRIVLIAAAMGFSRSIGVEFSAELCRIAGENVRRFRSKGGAQISPEIVLADAGDFLVPPGPVLAYLYNPFGPRVVDEVAARLQEKADGGDPVLVVYVDPQHLSGLEKRGWSVVAREPGLALLRVC